jgi:hypothetical protein
VKLAFNFLLAGEFGEFFDHRQQGLDALLEAEGQAAVDAFFADFSGADFDHVQAVFVASEDDVNVTEIHLRDGGVEDILRAIVGVDAADADGGGRAFVGHIADGECGVGCGA